MFKSVEMFILESNRLIRNAFRTRALRAAPLLSKRLRHWPNLSRGSGHRGQHQGATTLLIDGTDSPYQTCDSGTRFAVLLLLGLPGLAWQLESRGQWSDTINSRTIQQTIVN